MQGLFILGTDTEVGKTFCTAAITRVLLERGVKVGVYKPAESGCSAEQLSDSQHLHAATDGQFPIDRICPQRFSAPVAPPVAAKLEKRTVDESLLEEGALWWTNQCELLFVEGAGGVMSPISEHLTVLDLAEKLGYPTLLVAANRLGVVNHTLLSLEALNRRSLSCLGVLLNSIPTATDRFSDAETTAKAEHDDLARSTNRELLSHFLGDSTGETPLLESPQAIADLIAKHFSLPRAT